MILHRLRVERFRAHNLPVEIVFDDRLTVVSGWNEAGKSTLFTALQYAFFRRSSAKGKDIDSLAPWDTLGLSTGVTVEFSHGTHDYRLEKVWGKRAGTTLSRRTGSGAYAPFMETGADEFLASMFAGQPQKQGAFTGFNGQQLGLAHLLFVPQAQIAIAGEAKDIALNADARARLTEIVGAAAQSPQEARLCKRVIGEYDALFTLKGERRKIGCFRSLSEEIADVEAGIAQLREAIAAFAVVSDRLDVAKRAYRDAAEASRKAAEAAALALPRYEAAIALDRKRSEAALAHDRATSAYCVLLEESERYERTVREWEKLGPKRAESECVLHAAEAELTEATALRISASEEMARIGKPDAKLAALERELARAQKATIDRATFEACNRRLSNVIVRDERIRRIDAELAAFGSVTSEDFEELQRLLDAERTIAARLDATLTSVAIVAESVFALEMSVDGLAGEERLATGQRFEVKSSGASTFRIPGFATFEVRGPAADLADLKLDQATIAKNIASFVQRIGTRDAYELQRRMMTIASLKRERKEKFADRDRFLDGDSRATIQNAIDGLRDNAASAPASERIVELQALVDESKAQHALMCSGVAATMNAAALREARATTSAREARERAASAEATYRELELTMKTLAQSFATADERGVALKRAFTMQFESAQMLEAATEAFAPYAADRDPMTTYAALQTAASQRADEEHVAKIALVQVEREVERTYETAPSAHLVELEEKLAGLGLRAKDERLGDDAMKLLRAFVDDAERRRVERFAQPILNRVAPWFAEITGRKLMGLDLNANSELASVQLEGVERPVRFEELSQGTCDQLALLIRLAYASLLSAPDCLGPMPVLLDDPLVNADSGRRTRFHRVLESIAAGAQVIVFTCRPEDYANIDGRFTSIAAPSSAA